MPAKFNTCVKDGGRVRTIKLSKGRFRRICFKSGKSFVGEVRTKKISKAKGSKFSGALGG